MDEATGVVEKVKKAKKLSKVINGSVLTISEATTGAVLSIDANTLSDVIKAKLIMHGLSQKVGDSAAGTAGQESVDNITKVIAELQKGEWTTRVPAAEKITKSSILDTYNAMPEGKEKSALKSALEKIGIKIA
jgi:hypothetical protein